MSGRAPITKEEFDKLELILAKYQIPFEVSYGNPNGLIDRYIDIGSIVIHEFKHDEAEIVVKSSEKPDWNTDEEETI